MSAHRTVRPWVACGAGLLVLVAACSMAEPFPDSEPAAIAPQDVTAVTDLLDAAVPGEGAPVRGIDIGPPDLARSVVAAWVVANTGGPTDLGPARTLLADLQAGRFRPTPGGTDLTAVRAALDMAPQPRSSATDAALARALRAWRPVTAADAAAGALDTARLLRSQRDVPVPASAAAVLEATTQHRECTTADAASTWPEPAVQLARTGGVACTGSRLVASPVRQDSPFPALLDRWRTLADIRLLTGRAPTPMDGATEADAARRGLEATLAGSGSYSAGATVPLDVAGSLVAAARDLDTTLDVGPGNARLARAVAAADGGLADLPAPGSVLDGALGRIVLRWTTGRDAGSAMHPFPGRPDALDVAALMMFGETPAARPGPAEDAAAPVAPVAAEAVALLGDAADGTCDDPNLARFRTAVEQALAGGPVSSDELRVVGSGVAVWAALGLQATRSCADPAAATLAARVQDVVPSPSGGESPADVTAYRWIRAELSCLSVRPQRSGPATPPLTAAEMSGTAATSAVFGVGAISYMHLRTARIERAGCGNDVATVLRTW